MPAPPCPRAEESFAEAARRYEAWLGRYCRLDPAALAEKRRKMAKNTFAFLRGSFFRWEAYWAGMDERVRDAPVIPAVGDIHLENYGTWRDREGRLAWGINDLDEAAVLPFTSDLARLATSALLAARAAAERRVRGEADEDDLLRSPDDVVADILRGYRAGAESGAGEPFILEDRHPVLRDLAVASGRDAAAEWRDLLGEDEGKKPSRRKSVPAGAEEDVPRDLLLRHLPPGTGEVRFLARRSGLGSLGRPRFVAVGIWGGGLVAREAKAAAPSATRWNEEPPPADPLADQRRLLAALRHRAHDPSFALEEGWIVRRLSPEARKMEFARIRRIHGDGHDGAREEAALLAAMGRELANLHVEAAPHPPALRAHLDRLGEGDWLMRAAAHAAARVAADHASPGWRDG